jgi:glucose/arabinose dehydrogenase
MRTSFTGRIVCLVAASLAVSCGGGGDDGGLGGGDPGPGPTPPPPTTLTAARVFPNLTFNLPIAMVQAPADGTRWFVVEQDGIVRVFTNDATTTTSNVFLDISAQVASVSDGAGSETGLLGMAFDPQWAQNRRVFLYYTAPGPLRIHISEFRSLNDGQTLEPTSERILIRIDKPNNENNHNGGNLAFGPDGFLYAGVGDGGGAGDNHGAFGNGQDLNTLLGKIIRIDVAPATGYAIPPGNVDPGNPQCGGNGRGTARCPEIFAFGFRNPWRWSFDRPTGDLWVGDVGQQNLEEVDKVVLNGNYGWRCREGTNNFNATCGPAQNLLPPVAQYGRSQGFSVTGGYVYRGTAIPALQGRYVFGDFGSGNIWHIAANTAPTLDVTTATDLAPVFDSNLSISSFAEGNDAEIYVLHRNGATSTLHRLQTSP